MAKQTLQPIYRMVARDVALGIPLEDVATMRNLPLAEVKKVSSGRAFAMAVEKIQTEIDTQMAQEAAGDPVRQKLAGKALAAADQLGYEMELSEEAGGSSSTRLKAAEAILKFGGYGQQEQQTNLAVIMLSPGKMKAVQGIDEKLLESIPDCVDG